MGANLMWFANRRDEGVVYHTYFNPFPVELLALMLAVVSVICVFLLLYHPE